MTSFRWEYHEEAVKAGAILSKAIKDGELDRPDACELCGRTPQPVMVTTKLGTCFERPSIVGHHWQGYGKPLEVLWVCHSCNIKLSGKQFHNGTVTKEQSREYVLNFTRKKPPKSQAIKCKNAFTHVCGVEIRCGNWAQSGSDYCHVHRLNQV